MDLALNNLQRLICHKTKQTKPNHSGLLKNDDEDDDDDASFLSLFSGLQFFWIYKTFSKFYKPTISLMTDN